MKNVEPWLISNFHGTGFVLVWSVLFRRFLVYIFSSRSSCPLYRLFNFQVCLPTLRWGRWDVQSCEITGIYGMILEFGGTFHILHHTKQRTDCYIWRILIYNWKNINLNKKKMKIKESRKSSVHYNICCLLVIDYVTIKWSV